MNKNTALILTAVTVVVAGFGVAAYSNNQNQQRESDRMAMQKKAETAAMEKEKMMKKDEAVMEKTDADGEAMTKHGPYVSYDDYQADTAQYADKTKVLFFHASWCPICQSINKEVSADQSSIPENVVLIKTDFDSQTALRQKYGVTTQYTFVQVDENGDELKQWSATSLTKAIEGIQS